MATSALKTKSPIQYLDIVIGQYYRSLSKEYTDDGKGPFYNCYVYIILKNNKICSKNISVLYQNTK